MIQTMHRQYAVRRRNALALLAGLLLAATANGCKASRFQETPALLLQSPLNRDIQALHQTLDGATDPYARGLTRGRLALALWNQGDRPGAFAAAARALQEHPLAPEALGVYSFALERAGQAQAAAVYSELCVRTNLNCVQPEEFQPNFRASAGDVDALKSALAAALASGSATPPAAAPAANVRLVFEAQLTQDNGVRRISYAVREGDELRGEGLVEFVQESNRDAALATVLSDVETFLVGRERIELSSASGFLRGALTGCIDSPLEIVAEQSAAYVQRTTCRFSGEVPQGSAEFKAAALEAGRYQAPASQALEDAEALIAAGKYEQALVILEGAGSESEPGAEALLRGGGVIQAYLKDQARARAWYQRALERTRNADLHAEALVGLARAADSESERRKTLGLVLTHLRGTTAYGVAERELR